MYLETSFLSYLAARPSRDIVVAGHQALTHEWWELHSSRFRVCISGFVLREARRGNPNAARARLERAAGLPLLEIDEETLRLSRRIIESGIISERAEMDAAHVAVAMRHAVEYVLTWNCKHIANAAIQRRLARLATEEGYELPTICTPIELLGRDYTV
ncbi:MAG: type II toxin-antitoxin system VapC family toxin [Candidatus Hydrogenedentes bacterium]|nr:type II toxin-antitoxin system VapC family toxin [Candidatus Hydrogenedentota bacterium]